MERSGRCLSTISHQNSGWMYCSVSNIGPVVDGAWAGWTCIGNSIAVTDNGCSTTILTYGEHAEEVKLIDSSH